MEPATIFVDKILARFAIKVKVKTKAIAIKEKKKMTGRINIKRKGFNIDFDCTYPTRKTRQNDLH
ncbi:MAG: hypothetical protein M3040_06245 [Bacteroidota bacterium]|nr:hypothetical protein [Bacteroidota bacterium]